MLKLKNEYKGLIITKNVFGIGNITFDETKVNPIHYDNFAKIGFEELFEEGPDPDGTKQLLVDQSIKYEGIKQDKPKNKKKA